MKQKKYSSYKDSGIDWAQEIPSGWQVSKLKWVSRRFAGGTPDKSNDSYWENGTIPWLNSGKVNDWYITSPSTYITIEGYNHSSANWIPRGALVMALAGQGKTKGMVAQLGIDATCNQSMAAIVPNEKIEARFLLYWLFVNYSRIRNLAGGDLRDGLNLEMVGSINCLVPSTIEQQAIANYLDEEVSRIDAIITKKQEFVERLKEKRLALISNAITKGTNPNEELKPSGILWVDHIPRQWKTGKLKWYSLIYSGGTPDKTIDEYWEDGTVPWINSGAVNQRLISKPSALITQEAFLKSSAKWIPQNALVMALAGQGKTKGMVAQLAIKTTCNQSMAAIIPNKQLNSRYLLYWLEVNYQNIRNLAGGDQRDGLNLSMIGSIECLIPSLNEQNTIVELLDKQDIKHRAVVKKTEEAVCKLQEYKTALISAAVTGQIKVSDQA